MFAFQIYLNRLIIEDGKRRKKALEEASSSAGGGGTLPTGDAGDSSAKESLKDGEKTDDSLSKPDGSDDSSCGVAAKVSIRKAPLTAEQIEAETAGRVRELEDLFSQVVRFLFKRSLPGKCYFLTYLLTTG